MNIFYQSDLTRSQGSLNEEESRHCTKVLRLSQGATIYLIDGRGTYCEAILLEANSKVCKYKLINKITQYGKKNFIISIAIAPTKNIDRYEWFLEKVSEIGIDQVYPILCKYSERKDIKTDRLKKIMIAAIKQSQKAYLPELVPLIKFDELIKRPFEGDKFIAHCYEGEKQLLKNALHPGRNTLIFIGPEGDFSPSEVDRAIQEGFVSVSLGDSRLRTETAGLVACHTINLINQD